MRVTHTLSPIYDAASKILILGTMPSPKSREVGFYYGHPQNRFWRVMEALFDVSLKCPKDQVAFLHEKHIALYDVLEACRLPGSYLPICSHCSVKVRLRASIRLARKLISYANVINTR